MMLEEYLTGREQWAPATIFHCDDGSQLEIWTHDDSDKEKCQRAQSEDVTFLRVCATGKILCCKVIVR